MIFNYSLYNCFRVLPFRVMYSTIHYRVQKECKGKHNIVQKYDSLCDTDDPSRLHLDLDQVDTHVIIMIKCTMAVFTPHSPRDVNGTFISVIHRPFFFFDELMLL